MQGYVQDGSTSPAGTDSVDASSSGRGEVWARVEELIDRAQSVGDLRHHGVELLAARLWRRQGRCVPDSLRLDERTAAIKALGAPLLLKRARAAYDGELVLMKGAEVGALYPTATVRPFRDLDFLVDDPEAAHQAMVGAGFVEVGEPARYDGLHHTCPLTAPGIPLTIELHREPNRPVWLSPPSRGDLLELTQPSATGITGVLAPVPAAHALLVAAHSWAHAPLRRLLDLIDVTLLMEHDRDREFASELAQRWGLGRLWQTTIAAADALLGNPGSAPALPVWGRHLASVRERTVLETHLTRWAGPVCGLPQTRLRATGTATRIFANAARPTEGERWIDATRRTLLAIANATRPQSEHEVIKEARGFE